VYRFTDIVVVGTGLIGLAPEGEAVPDGELAAAITVRGARPLARAAKLALVASLRALGDEPRPSEPDPRAAVVLGTRGASLLPLAEFVGVANTQGPARVFPMAFPNTVASVHAGYLSTLLGRSGPVLTLCGSGAGLEALLEAALMIARGDADDVLACVADETLPDPTGLPGEGAAAVWLRREDETAGPLPSPATTGYRLLAVATADRAVNLPQFVDLHDLAATTKTVDARSGGLEQLVDSSRDSARPVVLTGMLGVRGAGSALLLPLRA
jgi:hypothetical protein